MGTEVEVPRGCQPCLAAGGKGLLSALAAGVFSSLTARQSCGGEDGAGGGIQGTCGEMNRQVKRQHVGGSQEHNGSCLRGVFSSALMRGKYLEVSCCPSPIAGAAGRQLVASAAHLGWENLAAGFLLRKQVPFPACPWSDALAGAAVVPVLSMPLLVQRAPGQEAASQSADPQSCLCMVQVNSGASSWALFLAALEPSRLWCQADGGWQQPRGQGSDGEWRAWHRAGQWR